MFSFNGKNASEFGIVFDSFPSIQEGEERVRDIIIAGRDEPLTISDGTFTNSLATFTGHVIGDSWGGVLSWLKGDGKLVYDSTPDYFHRARILNLSKLKLTEGLTYFTLGISQSAYSYLISGESVTTGSTVVKLVNVTPYKAYPLIKINGSGDLIVYLNGKVLLTIKGVNGAVSIDSEIDYIYSDSGSMDRQSIGEVPILLPGSNTLSVSGSVTSIEVTPRWRTKL